MIQEFYQQGRFFQALSMFFIIFRRRFFVIVKSQFFLVSSGKFAGQYTHQAKCDGKSNNAIFHDPMGIENRNRLSIKI